MLFPQKEGWAAKKGRLRLCCVCCVHAVASFRAGCLALVPPPPAPYTYTVSDCFPGGGTVHSCIPRDLFLSTFIYLHSARYAYGAMNKLKIGLLWNAVVTTQTITSALLCPGNNSAHTCTTTVHHNGPNVV